MPEVEDIKREIEFATVSKAKVDEIHSVKYDCSGPYRVQLDLTNNCNSNCVGCWIHSDYLGDCKMDSDTKKKFLPFELVKKLIDELSELGTKEIQLAGSGEPFMHPNCMEIIEYTKNKGLTLEIVTNFTLVNPDMMKHMVGLKVDFLTISLWAGTADTYFKLHPDIGKSQPKGIKGLFKDNLFDHIKSNLRFFHDLKEETHFPRLKIFNVISKWNFKEIEKMLDFALDSFVEVIEFQVIDTIPGKTEFLALDLDDKKRVMEQIKALRKRKDFWNDPRTSDNFKFFKNKTFAEGFKYSIASEKNFFQVKCPKGDYNSHIDVDHLLENAMMFFFPKEGCKSCNQFDSCSIDKSRHLVKAEYVDIQGVGTFEGKLEAPPVNSIPCYVGWVYARILTNGDVIPCCKAHLFPLGNLHKSSFKDIWNSESYKKFRKNALNLDKSDKYFDKIDCLKGCDNFNVNLDIDMLIKESYGKK